MRRQTLKLAVLGGVLTLSSCAREAAKNERSAEAVDTPSLASSSSASASAPSSETSGAKSLSIGGKPIETITSEELVAAVGAQGWLPPKDLPPGMVVMVRKDGGRESLLGVFDKQGKRLNVMIVRAIPGAKLEDGSVASAKSTHQAFQSMGKPTAMSGESAVVVHDGAIGVPGATKQELQALFDALVK